MTKCKIHMSGMSVTRSSHHRTCVMHRSATESGGYMHSDDRKTSAKINKEVKNVEDKLTQLYTSDLSSFESDVLQINVHQDQVKKGL